MNAGELRQGDTFVERSAEDWEMDTPAERRKHKRFKMLDNPIPCRTAPDRVHFRCSAGTWCIPALAPAMVLIEQVREAVA